MNLTAEAQQASTRGRLAEQVLMDAVQERAIAEHKRVNPKATPPAVVVFTKDVPQGGAWIAGQPVTGRAGQLALVDAGVAAVLKDAAYLEVRDPLQVPPGERPAVAGELRAIVEELQAAADLLDPQGV